MSKTAKSYQKNWYLTRRELEFIRSVNNPIREIILEGIRRRLTNSGFHDSIGEFSTVRQRRRG